MSTGTAGNVIQLHKAQCCFLQVALPGRPPENAGVLLLDPETDALYLKLRRDWEQFAGEEEDVLALLEEDLRGKAKEMGGERVLEWLEENLSNLLRITAREQVVAGDFDARLRGLYKAYVPARVLPYRTHLPLTSCRAAAGHLSPEAPVEAEGWVEAPENLRLSEGLFVAQVHGHSMEPRIPDGTLCVFRRPVTGSRDNRLLLIQKHGEFDETARFTIKRYRSRKIATADGGWRHEEIRLEPLNPAFETWTLAPDQFEVVAEFVSVLPPEE